MTRVYEYSWVNDVVTAIKNNAEDWRKDEPETALGEYLFLDEDIPEYLKNIFEIVETISEVDNDGDAFNSIIVKVDGNYYRTGYYADSYSETPYANLLEGFEKVTPVEKTIIVYE